MVTARKVYNHMHSCASLWTGCTATASAGPKFLGNEGSPVAYAHLGEGVFPPMGEDIYPPVSEYLQLQSAAALEPPCLRCLSPKHPSRLGVVFIHASKRPRYSKCKLVCIKHWYSRCYYSVK